jgi:YD repeat-containing protein
MIRKITYWCLVACLAVQGFRCSTPEKSTLCFVTSLTETEGSQTRVYTYTYELSRLTTVTLSASGTTTVTTYGYDDNGNAVSSTTQSPSGLTEGTYSYDKQNKLVSAFLKSGSDETTIQFVYNDNGQLITEVRQTTSGVGDLVVTTTFAYPDILTKNPSVITITSGGGAANQVTREYDNKIAPLRSLFPTTRAVNNVVKETSLNGTTLEETTTTITYQYNPEGYPVSSISSSGRTQVWVYDCREI